MSLANIVAWLTRSLLFFFFLLGTVIGPIIEQAHYPITYTFVLRVLTVPLGAIIFNLYISGSFTKRPEDNKFKDLILIDTVKVSPFQTLLFLLQGPKSKSIMKNIKYLDGVKKIFKTTDNTQIYIEDAQIGGIQGNYLITITFLFSVLILLLVTPIIWYIVFFVVKFLLVYLDISVKLAGSLCTIFSFTFILYWIVPHVYSSKSFRHASIIYGRKKIGERNNISIYTSPLIPFINSSCFENIGFSDNKNKSIYINPNYVDSGSIYNYIVAHEEGHLRDRLNSVVSFVCSPLMMPCATFIIWGIGISLKLAGQNQTGNLVSGIGVSIPFVVIVIYFISMTFFETRADDFAVKSLGYSNVINAMQQLNQRKDTIGGMYSLGHLNSFSFSKRIERINQKWGKT